VAAGLDAIDGKEDRAMVRRKPHSKVGDELFIKPVEETFEACKAAVQMDNFATTWQHARQELRSQPWGSPVAARPWESGSELQRG
jgi:hypothetical protein